MAFAFCTTLESTCWEPPDTKPAGEESDIIEVGWALVDPKTMLVDEHGTYLVKPERSTVSPFCTQLTTITHSCSLPSASPREPLNLYRQAPLHSLSMRRAHPRQLVGCRRAHLRQPGGASS